jgi:hypothetical protein
MNTRTLAFSSLIVLTAAASAQIWTPEQTQVGAPGARGKVVLQATNFDLTGDGAGSKTGLFIGGEYLVQPTFSIGGWYASDRNVGGTDYDWLNLRGTHYFGQTEQGVYGVSLGYLQSRARMEGDTTNLHWVEGALTGTLPLDRNAPGGPRFHLNGRLGYAVGIKSRQAGADVTPSNAIVYGVGASYRITDQISLETSAHVMNFTDTGAGQARRFNFGVGFSF